MQRLRSKGPKLRSNGWDPKAEIQRLRCKWFGPKSKGWIKPQPLDRRPLDLCLGPQLRGPSKPLDLSLWISGWEVLISLWTLSGLLSLRSKIWSPKAEVQRLRSRSWGPQADVQGLNSKGWGPKAEVQSLSWAYKYWAMEGRWDTRRRWRRWGKFLTFSTRTS